MSTYYNNGNNNNTQGAAPDHGLQTLFLMNPTTPYHPHHNYLGSYNSSHTQQQAQQHHHHRNNNNNNNDNNNLVFLNSNPSQHHLVGIPLDPHHEISALHHAFMPRVHNQQGEISLTLSASPLGGSTSSPEVSKKVNFGVKGVLGSRYLKAAQELLDEVVSVGNEVVKVKVVQASSTVVGEEGSGCGGGERVGRGKISTAERQEILMKKAKLVGMLDEVERRYRQYHHQMQIVISWFEQATGICSAKTYTALALQTISKQSRCLKDAISTQIQASSQSLGEEDSFGGGKKEGSRLKFVDHHIRQQRALQQLGMIQPNAWRPQRGLPERSVSVLRAWLFEHFLHPYPKDSDKIMLANQTGLTRSQVSNWFINARVRLWKPMVEDMYTEEIKNPEQNGSTNQNSPPVITASQSPSGINIRNQPGFTLIRSPDMESISQASPKKQRNTEFMQSPNSYLSNEQISMKFGDERQNRESFTLMGGPANFIGGFEAYPIDEIGRFGAEQISATYSGNGVSLSLGLPHCENLSLSGAHQSFYQNQNIQMGRRLEIGEPDEFATINTSTPSHSSIAYESINIQNQKRFPAQLLPDFVTSYNPKDASLLLATLDL